MVFFQTCNRTHSDCLPVVDSPSAGGWCLVTGDVFHTFPH